MKKILTVLALAAITTGFAQENKNTKEEKVITKTAVKTDDGVNIATKAVTSSSKQVIELDNSDANKTNQSMVMKPIDVNTSVSYDYDGNRFKFLNQKDESGYRLMTVKDNLTEEEYAIIKPLSQNGYYIMSKAGKSSFGYFDTDGNFVVERYDPSVDAIVSDIYKLDMKKATLKE